MKFVRFIIVSALLLCILLSASYYAVAEAEWNANITVKQTSLVSADGTFGVRVSVTDITTKNGIVCAIYHLHFDPTVVQLISWENSNPEKWDFSGNTSFGAEDWTDLLEDDNGNPYLMYTVMNTSLEYGVTADNVLYTDLVFKVLSDSAKTTEIVVTDISFMDKNLADDCVLSDRKLEVSLVSDESSEEESSEDSSQAASSEEASSEYEESSAVSEESFVSQESSQENSADESEEESSQEESVPDETTVEDSAESSVAPDGSGVISEETDSSEQTEDDGERIVMTVLLKDIKDEFGISALQFKLNYKPTLLEFVDYEIILPDNWDLGTEYTEDVCSVGKNGDLLFGVMNFEVGCGVKADDILGFKIVFKTKNVSFDPSLITMDKIEVINDDLKEVAPENYRLAISYEGKNGTIADDSFESEQDNGKGLKIVIVVVVCIVLLGIAVSAFLMVRKKKQA